MDESKAARLAKEEPCYHQLAPISASAYSFCARRTAAIQPPPDDNAALLYRPQQTEHHGDWCKVAPASPLADER
jgi:hypothetical protein